MHIIFKIKNYLLTRQDALSPGRPNPANAPRAKNWPADHQRFSSQIFPQQVAIQVEPGPRTGGFGRVTGSLTNIFYKNTPYIKISSLPGQDRH